MNPPGKNQQIEFDVFPKDNRSQYGYLSDVVGPEGRATSSVNVIFSHQSVFLIFICAMMLLVASFALGVEKGKLIARRGAEAPAQVALTTPEAPAPVQTGNAGPAEKTVVTAKAQAPVQADLSADKAPEKTPAEKPVRSGYAIQVASVESPSAAETLAESLAKKGYDSFTKKSGKYVVVLAGNFKKREDAQGSLKELKKTFSDCFIKQI